MAEREERRICIIRQLSIKNVPARRQPKFHVQQKQKCQQCFIFSRCKMFRIEKNSRSMNYQNISVITKNVKFHKNPTSNHDDDDDDNNIFHLSQPFSCSGFHIKDKINFFGSHLHKSYQVTTTHHTKHRIIVKL